MTGQACPNPECGALWDPGARSCFVCGYDPAAAEPAAATPGRVRNQAPPMAPLPGPPPPDSPDGLDESKLAAIAARYTPVDWHAAWKDQPDAVDWLIEPFLEVGTINAWFGKPEAGKSLLALEDCLTLIRSGHVVVYIDEENRISDHVERLQAFGATPGELDRLKMFSFAGLPPLDTIGGGVHLLALAVTHGASLVVLDTSTRMVQGKENDSDTFIQLYRCSLVPLKRRGITVLRLDHPGKDESRGQRGSSAKDGDVDTIWRLAKDRDQVTFRFTRTKSRNSHGEGAATRRRKYGPLRHEWAVRGESPEAKIIGQLERLKVPRDAGRTAAGQALRDAGIKVSNAQLTAAIRLRKSCPGQLADSSDSSAVSSGCPSVPPIGTDSRTAPAPVSPAEAIRAATEAGIQAAADAGPPVQDRTPDEP